MKRILWLTGLAVVVISAKEASGQTYVPYDRIEEDWEVVIGEPSPEDEAPQILNVFSPGGTYDSSYYIFELNHSTQPDYHAGGMQLQRWTGDWVRDWRTLSNANQLSYPGETITYTLRMRLQDNYLYASVRNGQSQTWGQFGGFSQLGVAHWTDLTDLNGYRTSSSTAKSRIGFASHRVVRFVLKEVRYYSNGELVSTDDADVVVHEQN